jgi:hypothetical protein
MSQAISKKLASKRRLGSSGRIEQLNDWTIGLIFFKRKGRTSRAELENLENSRYDTLTLSLLSDWSESSTVTPEMW